MTKPNRAPETEAKCTVCNDPAEILYCTDCSHLLDVETLKEAEQRGYQKGIDAINHKIQELDVVVQEGGVSPFTGNIIVFKNKEFWKAIETARKVRQ